MKRLLALQVVFKVTVLCILSAVFSSHVAEAAMSMGGMDNFGVVLTTIPSSPISQATTTLTFAINESGTRMSWNQLQVTSGRRLHVVIVSENLNMLGHIHPEDFMNGTEADGSLSSFSVNFTFPWPGLYGISMEFEPVSGSTIKRQFNVTVGGTGVSKPLTSPTSSLTHTVKSLSLGIYQEYVSPIIVSDIQDLPSSASPNSFIVSIKPTPTTVKSMECSQMVVTFSNATTKSSLVDMTTYLDHPMHVVIVAHGLGFIDHIHGDVATMNMRTRKLMETATSSSSCGKDEMTSTMTMANKFGPSLQVFNNFTTPGTYTLFFQTSNQNHSQLLVSSFSLTVADGGGMGSGTSSTRNPLVISLGSLCAILLLNSVFFSE